MSLGSSRSSSLEIPSFTSIRQDLVAGVVVGIIALPLSIALAVAVGAPPVAGLYTAVFAGAVASITGGSNFNITGPTAALVPLLSAAVLRYGVGALPTVGLMAGVMLIVMGVLKFGRLMRFMPGLVIVGFTAGIALSIAFGQLNNFLDVTGTDPKLEHFHEKLWSTLSHLGSVGWTTPLVGLASLALLIGWPR
ncbi:MAG: SulP family inorganic anion transporter, partial [Anaerolineaceae bacterium]